MSSHRCTGNPCWLCYPPAIPAGPYTPSPPPKGGTPREHELKTHPGPFQALVDGLKPFEIRRNDRGYQAGDRLWLREWNPEVGRYTGRELRRDVVYVLAGGQFGIRRGFVAMGLRSRSIEGAREEGKREGLRSALRALGEAEVVEHRGPMRMYAQLGDAKATLAAVIDEVRALLEKP